jgi:IS5 family transposase
VVYAPVPKPKNANIDPYLAKDGDSPAVGAWRERMGTDEAQDRYQERAATAECVKAVARQRGLLRLRVRGTAKVRGVLLMYALAHNLMRTFALGARMTRAWGRCA